MFRSTEAILAALMSKEAALKSAASAKPSWAGTGWRGWRQPASGCWPTASCSRWRHGEKRGSRTLIKAVLLVITELVSAQDLLTSWIASFHRPQALAAERRGGTILGLVALGFASVFRAAVSRLCFSAGAGAEVGSPWCWLARPQGCCWSSCWAC